MPLFRAFKWPDTMPDKDTVWRPTGRETEDEMVARAGKGLAIIVDSCRDEDVCELGRGMVESTRCS